MHVLLILKRVIAGVAMLRHFDEYGMQLHENSAMSSFPLRI